MSAMHTAAAVAALFGSVLLLPATTAAQNPAAPGIAGYLNPATGVFTARPALLPAAKTLQRIGSITVTVTAVLGSNIPTSVPLTCGVSIGSSDSAADNSAGASGVLVRSKTGGTCKVSIPYIFEVAATTTPMSVSASLFASTSTTPSISYSASTSITLPSVPNKPTSVAVTLAM
jgi:hypothetical protein